MRDFSRHMENITLSFCVRACLVLLKIGGGENTTAAER